MGGIFFNRLKNIALFFSILSTIGCTEIQNLDKTVNAYQLFSDGVSHYENYEYAQAIKKLETAEEIYRSKSFNSQKLRHDVMADLYLVMGHCYYHLNDIEKALSHLIKSLSYFTKLRKHKDMATGYHLIGKIYNVRFRPARAQEYFEIAIRHYKQSMNSEGRDRLLCLLLLDSSEVLYTLGKYDQAYEYVQEAMYLANILNDGRIQSTADFRLGELHRAWGQYNIANEYYSKAFSAPDQKYNNEFRATILIRQGQLHNSSGRSDQAETLFEEAGGMIQGITPAYLDLLNVQGKQFVKRGNLGRAREWFEKAIDILEESEQAYYSFLMESVALKALGNYYLSAVEVYLKLKEYNLAIKTLKKAEQLAYAQRDKNFYAKYYLLYGKYYWETENYKEAISKFEDAIKKIEYIRENVEGDVKRDFLAKQILAYRYLISCYTILKNPEKALEATQYASTRYTNELLAQREPSLDYISDSFQIRKIQDKLGKDLGLLIYANIDWDENQPTLILVTKSKIKVFGLGNGKKIFKKSIDHAVMKWGSNDASNAGLKKNDKQIFAILDDGESASFENTITYYRHLIKTSNLSPTELELRNTISQELYKYLLSPVKNDLNGILNLVIIPDGTLALIPFEALRVPESKYSVGKYLVESYSIRYSQSLILNELISERKKYYTNQRKPFIGFSEPVYERRMTKPEPMGNQEQFRKLASVYVKNKKDMSDLYAYLLEDEWDQLVFSKQMMRDIAKVIGFGDEDIYSAEDADETRLKIKSYSGELKNYKVIHFATHGFSYPPIPELSTLVLSQYINSNKGDDGYLTMNEIKELNLRADMVNLSACHSGIGKIIPGEGLVGLTQAFIVAGANSVSVSLWNINEFATKDFMLAMYREFEFQRKLNGNQNYSDAFNTVKRKFIQKDITSPDGYLDYSEPAYWAPFVFYGNF